MTSVAPGLLSPSAGGDGTYSTSFADGTMSWAGVHGGVVIGRLLIAVQFELARPPATVSAHLHGPASQGAADIAVVTNHAGRTVSSAQATLTQDRLKATASVLAVPRPDATAQQWSDSFAPRDREVDPDRIPRLEMFDDVMPFARHLDIRPLGEQRPLAGGPDPALRAWIRPAEAVPYGPALAVLLLDALAPSLYATLTEPVVIPTIEFTAHFTGLEEPGPWYHVQQRTVWSTPILCVDEAELHAPDGRLLAHSRQLRRILPAL